MPHAEATHDGPVRLVVRGNIAGVYIAAEDEVNDTIKRKFFMPRFEEQGYTMRRYLKITIEETEAGWLA